MHELRLLHVVGIIGTQHRCQPGGKVPLRWCSLEVGRQKGARVLPPFPGALRVESADGSGRLGTLIGLTQTEKISDFRAFSRSRFTLPFGRWLFVFLLALRFVSPLSGIVGRGNGKDG